MSHDSIHSNDEQKVKPLIAETKICSICLISGSTDDNDPIVYCDRCGVIVHESCYNADTLDDKSSDSSSPSEYWFCTPCLANIDDPICALCPRRDRCDAFWPTLESSWVHVVCALGIPGVLFYDELYYTPVDLSNIPSQKFGSKTCIVCESHTGVTVPCDAGLCPNAFHLSCANKNGLLQIRGELSKIECELYCVNHQSATNVYKIAQRNYTVCEVQQKQLNQKNNLDDEVKKMLTDHLSIYKKRCESFPRLPKPSKSHIPRSLLVDPVALNNFFDKSQRLRSSDSASLENNPDLTSTNTNALLAFTANEEELCIIRQRISDVENKLSQLEASSNDKHLQEEHKKLETELKKEYETLQSLTERLQEVIEIFKLYDCKLKNDTLNLLEQSKSPQISSTENDCCSICKTINRSKQTIKCCQCHLAFHGDCLTPAMPAKTLSIMLSASKKYDWQCASCVNAQQEELDQRNVNIDEPRQTRPRRTNELVLRETVIKFGSRKRKQDSTENNENTKIKTATDQQNQSAEKNENERKSETSKCRTSVIQQLLTKKPKDSNSETKTKQTPTELTSKERKSSSSIKLNDPLKTPVRSKSLTSDSQKTVIFKEKSKSAPIKKSEKKKQSSSKNPMSIFDFYDDDDDESVTIELHSSKITTNSNNDEKKTKSKNRRSTLTIPNNVPSDVQCRECSSRGTDQNMTDCDKCKQFYHYACCVPPLTSFPKRRNYGWSCHRCNNDSEHEGSDDQISVPPLKKSKRERKTRRENDGKQITTDS